MRQHQKRERLLVDHKVQGALVFGVARYWIACVVTIELLNMSWQIATGPDQPTFFWYIFNHDWRPSLVRIAASAVLLVPILFDVLRLSNRFAGPVFRMQRTLRNFVETGDVETVRLREKDFWHDFADLLNQALSKLTGQRQPISPVAVEQPLAEPVAI